MSSLEQFKKSFKGDIVTPLDPDYNDAISRWAVNAIRRARLVCFVKDAEDASLAVKYAAAEKLSVAIRGGGHSASGASSLEDGLVIDLSRYLKGVRIDAENKTAYVEGGAIWETVDKAAIEHGLAVVAGTVNDTGVGGLSLGGGYGWLTSKHGLTLDNILQVTIVTADGSILTANEHENPDLFWAVRGGGCNFGVVTEFVFRLHDQRRMVYGGMLLYPLEMLESVVKATQEWWDGNPSENEAMFHVLSIRESKPVISVMPFYNGTEEEGRRVYKAFLDLQPIDQTAAMPYEKLNELQNAAAPRGHCWYFRGVTQNRVDLNVHKAVMKRMMDLAQPDFKLLMLFQLFPSGKINSVAKDGTAFNSRGPHCNVIGVSGWVGDSQENSAKGKDLVYQITDIVANSEEKPEESKTRGYGNYVGDEFLSADRSAKLFGDNYPRLQALKHKYDPNMMFARWFVITPSNQ